MARSRHLLVRRRFRTLQTCRILAHPIVGHTQRCAADPASDRAGCQPTVPDRNPHRRRNRKLRCHFCQTKRYHHVNYLIFRSEARAAGPDTYNQNL